MEQVTRFKSDVYVLFIAEGDKFTRPRPRADENIERGYFSRWKWKFNGDVRAVDEQHVDPVDAQALQARGHLAQDGGPARIALGPI